MERVTDSYDRKRILDTVRAIEGHAMLSCIAMGIFQLVSMYFTGEESIRYQRHLRTPSKETVSEAIAMYYLRKYIFRIMDEKARIINNTNNSKTAGKVWNPGRITGFLGLGTFHCQVHNNKKINRTMKRKRIWN